MIEPYITFEPIGGDQYKIAYSKPPTQPGAKTSKEEMERLLELEPYNLSLAMELSMRYGERGRYTEACEVRFKAATLAIDSIPEDEDNIELEWESVENQIFIEIIATSGIDLYLHGDFELSATLLETALELDPEDHLGVIPSLIFSYLVIQEWEGYEELKSAFPHGSIIEGLVENFAAYRQERVSELPFPKAMAEEFSVNRVEVDKAFFLGEGANLSHTAQEARELWYSHLPIFEIFPEFVEKHKTLKR